jgi:hypothetical protein
MVTPGDLHGIGKGSKATIFLYSIRKTLSAAGEINALIGDANVPRSMGSRGCP